jgi:hypothetical protein
MNTKHTLINGSIYISIISIAKEKITKDRSPPSIVLSFYPNFQEGTLTPSPHVRHKSIPKNKKDVLAIKFKTLLNSTK